MLLVNINGPINSGKTTVCKILEKKLENCLFIEVDNLLSDDEQKTLCYDFYQGISERLSRLDHKIKENIEQQKIKVLLFAYPLSDKNYLGWKAFENEETKLICITLSPPLEVCLKNRGERTLEEREILRIKEMHTKNYNVPKGSNLIINNAEQTPQKTAQIIMDYLRENVANRSLNSD